MRQVTEGEKNILLIKILALLYNIIRTNVNKIINKKIEQFLRQLQRSRQHTE